MVYQYKCSSCEETYYREEKAVHYCDWVDCDNEEPLEYIRPVEAIQCISQTPLANTKREVGKDET